MSLPKWTKVDLGPSYADAFSFEYRYCIAEPVSPSVLTEMMEEMMKTIMKTQAFIYAIQSESIWYENSMKMKLF